MFAYNKILKFISIKNTDLLFKIHFRSTAKAAK